MSSEWRTAAQIEADQNLHKAVADVLAAYSDEPEIHHEFMLTDYMVLSVRSGMTEEKAGHTHYEYSFSNGSLPAHVGLGLVKWAEAMLLRQTLEDGEG